jgi:hypothetical protein
LVTLRGKVYIYLFILKAFLGSDIVYFGEKWSPEDDMLWQPQVKNITYSSTLFMNVILLSKNKININTPLQLLLTNTIILQCMSKYIWNIIVLPKKQKIQQASNFN